MIYCTSCGTGLQDDAAFCSKCGKKTETPTITSNTLSTEPITAKLEAKPVTNTTTTIQTNPAIMTGAFWGSLMVLTGFFMPWIKMWGDGINGYNIASMIGNSRSNDSSYSILFYLIPISAAIFLIAAFMGKVSGFAKFVRFIPLAILLFAAISIISNSDSDSNDSWNSIMRNFSDAIGFGLILSFIGAIVMCFYNPKKP